MLLSISKHSFAKFKRRIAPHVPAWVMHYYSQRKEVDRRKLFGGTRHIVGETVAKIEALTESQCADVDFLEHTFIPSLGLNDEMLAEQPAELSAYFGKGLHLWQYPSQLANYLAWITENSSGITSYMEIGCRWGGTFILISEWIRKTGGQLRSVIAVDPIRPTPFIEAYFELLRQRAAAGQSPIEAIYLCEFSTSAAVREVTDRIRPDFIFVDGDHELQGALADHLLARKYARIIVHHDVCSKACPSTTFLWDALKEMESHEFECFEFVNQYPSVNGTFLGIGAMKRKK